MRRRTTCLLAAALLLAVPGCSSGDETADAATTTGTSPSPTAPESSAGGSPTETPREKEVEVRVSVTDGKVTPAARRVEVERDSRVRLLITSDVDDEVHVHGYDIEEPLEAGRTTTVELVADQSGIFEVETHESGLALLQLEVR